MKEKSLRVIPLYDVKPEYVRMLINYLYSGRITITEENVKVRSGCTVNLNNP